VGPREKKKERIERESERKRGEKRKRWIVKKRGG